MSTKKEKLLEEAQRLVLRGQLDKAIKLYGELVALDPAAINHRQRLADLLLKGGRIEEARAQFETIGKHYSSHGFYLKAIAVYKKLQVLFPSDPSITLQLAQLNEKNGLLANALAEYKQVYDHYERNSEPAEALRILEKMQQADKQNVGIKLKLAESYFQAGRPDDAYGAFSRLAGLLQERGDQAGFRKIVLRIQQLFPERIDFAYEVLAEQVSSGKAAGAVDGIQGLLRNNPRDRRLWVLIIDAYRQLGRPELVNLSCRHFLSFFPRDTTARVWMISSLAAQRDVPGALALLDRFEESLGQGAAEELLNIYRSLEQLDPVNMRLLEGYHLAAEAAGKPEMARELEQRIVALRSVAASQVDQEAEQVRVEQTRTVQAGDNEPDPGEPPPRVQETVPGGASRGPDAEFSFSESLGIAGDEAGEEIEIEIEVDDGFEQLAVDAAGDDGDAWLESVGEIFDSVAVSPSSVRFGSDLEGADPQSHYDLGIAFREMGLYDEAINEFRAAAAGGGRKIECLVLQGACLRDKGNLEQAETLLGSLLKPGLSLETACSVRYELALTLERSGRQEEAARLFSEIDALSPGFRDVRSRLDSGDGGSSLEFSDEDLEGFDLG